MNLQESIRRILREEYIPTETEYLGWYIPRKLYDELENIGIKIWDKENDKVYIAEFQFDTKSVVFEILDSTGEAYFNSLFPIPSSYKSYHTKKIKDLPTSIKYFILRRFEQEWVNIMDKYDDDGKIIQENIRRVLKEESINLKKDPVSYYYYKYLNENPIEFKELYLVPTWTGERIEWEVDNPNDYSYSRDLINEVLRDEFRSFCDITNTNERLYYHLSSCMNNTPNCYISKKDRKHINVNGKKIKQIDFSGIRYRYEFDFDYERTSVTSHEEELEVYVYGNITNLIKTDLQYDEKIDREEISPRHFISDMLDSDYDHWQEKLYDILLPMYNIFYNNPRIFDNRYDFFNVGLQQTP